MNELALFAGAGGGILGGGLLGWETVCAVEINPFCVRRLMQRQNEGHIPLFPIWDDVCTFDGTIWKGYVDIISGGFPFQAFSSAAHGNNTARDFWPEMRRIVSEIMPKYVFAENVSRVAIERAAIDCRLMGYKTKAISLSAKDLGADHERERFWLLAHADMHGELCSEEYAKTSMLQEFCRGIWETFSDEFRMVDGMANRMDRIRSIGNGQIPIVAATAFTILKERLMNGNPNRM